MLPSPRQAKMQAFPMGYLNIPATPAGSTDEVCLTLARANGTARVFTNLGNLQFVLQPPGWTPPAPLSAADAAGTAARSWPMSHPVSLVPGMSPQEWDALRRSQPYRWPPAAHLPVLQSMWSPYGIEDIAGCRYCKPPIA